jgi:hypothetical protein
LGKIYFYVTVQISWYTSVIQIILEKQYNSSYFKMSSLHTNTEWGIFFFKSEYDILNA